MVPSKGDESSAANADDDTVDVSIFRVYFAMSKPFNLLVIQLIFFLQFLEGS